MAVSFDLFGTLVRVERTTEPAAAIARELDERGVPVPKGFAAAYAEPHVDAPDGAEVPLDAHVAAVLSSFGVTPQNNAARRAVVAAFQPDADRRDGADEAIAAAREGGPVGVLSNCSVPGLVEATLRSAGLEDAFDSVVTSVGCGWRKPNPSAFEAIADALDADPSSLVHVGDDPRTDGGVTAVGGQYVSVAETSLETLPGRIGGES